MNYTKIILFIYFKVIQIQELDTRQNDNEDKWIWGYVDEDKGIENKNTDDKVQNTTQASYDPCEFYNPVKPNFNVLGKRITDQKCDEYTWEVERDDERIKRDKECFDKKYANKPKPPAAVGGRPTYLGEFPHMGAIGWKSVLEGYQFKCGSTLISSKFVLTAAHCSSVSELDTTIADTIPKIVRLNDKNLFVKDDKGIFTTMDFNISRIIIHPKYNPPKKYYDIALMELEDEVDFTRHMRPACLWTKPDVTELGQDATLTGWGVLTPGSFDISPELQAADVNFIPSDQCDRLLYSSRNRNWWGVMEHQICAGKLAGGVDACKGDSGGPLQVIKQNTSRSKIYNVVGVTSFGVGCALPNLPGIYTRVSSFIDWIEEIVWKSPL